MTDDVEERLDEIEQRIVANMGKRTKGLYPPSRRRAATSATSSTSPWRSSSLGSAGMWTIT
jgi:hypothetical protein